MAQQSNQTQGHRPSQPRDGPARAAVRTEQHREQTARITRSLLGHVERLAAACGATAVFVYSDALGGGRLPVSDRFHAQVHYVVKTPKQRRLRSDRGERAILVPDVPLTRMGQVKLAVFLAYLRGGVREGDVVLCLAGPSDAAAVDALSVVPISGDGMLGTLPDQSLVPADVQPEVVERAINLSVTLAGEGREGKPVGALFVVGDFQQVRRHVSQLILNPLRGHAESRRNILDVRLEETIKELAQLDGAFLVRGDGVIETCGSCIETTGESTCDDIEPLPPGLGARHHAAAAITALTESMAIALSESTGTVTIFRNGRPVTAIKRPHVSPHAGPP